MLYAKPKVSSLLDVMPSGIIDYQQRGNHRADRHCIDQQYECASDHYDQRQHHYTHRACRTFGDMLAIRRAFMTFVMNLLLSIAENNVCHSR
jgi:hypothetical protein